MRLPKFLFLLLMLGLMGLAACAAAPTTPPPATPQPSLPPAPTLTETLPPSATPLPSSTPQPSASATIPLTSTPQATSSSTPRPAFAGFHVDFVEYTYYGMQFAFLIPGIKENYRLIANEIPYTCNFYEKYPNKLYCTGPAIRPYTEVNLAFLALKGSDTPLFEAQYQMGSMITPTIPLETLKASNPTNCPQHGVNVRCETEYRKIATGCCIVATCVDACGYYFSVDTCPRGMDMQGICAGPVPTLYPGYK